jgi:hypothetical protein
MGTSWERDMELEFNLDAAMALPAPGRAPLVSCPVRVMPFTPSEAARRG